MSVRLRLITVTVNPGFWKITLGGSEATGGGPAYGKLRLGGSAQTSVFEPDMARKLDVPPPSVDWDHATPDKPAQGVELTSNNPEDEPVG